MARSYTRTLHTYSVSSMRYRSNSTVSSKKTLPPSSACRRILPVLWFRTSWRVSKYGGLLMRAFPQPDLFVSDVEARKLRPAYVFVGDEVFFRKRCREALVEHLVPADLRDFSLFDFDLSETDLAEVLDRARTPSLMAPFQVFFVRGVKTLFGRGSNDEKLAAIEQYCKNPNPDALLVFVADHISIPADVRRMEMQDKERYQRIRETMGQYCGIVELARVEEGEAVRWISDYCSGPGVGVKIEADGARELVDALGGDMMMISNELEKLILYVGEKKRITLGDVETMV